jgi:hypothetical protein
MLALFGLGLALVVVVVLICAEVRSAWCEIALSNGVDVLVDPEMYEDILSRFQMAEEPHPWKRWDQAVLSVLRARRPRECEYLARTLAQETSREETAWCRGLRAPDGVSGNRARRFPVARTAPAATTGWGRANLR